MTVSGPFYLFRRGRIYYVQYALDGVIKQKSTGCTTKGAATAYVELLRDRVCVRPIKASRPSEYIRDYLKLKHFAIIGDNDRTSKEMGSKQSNVVPAARQKLP